MVSRVFPVICLSLLPRSPPTSLSSLADLHRELFTDLDFRFTFCSGSGSLEVSSFQLREVESACVLGDLIHNSTFDEFRNQMQ